MCLDGKTKAKNSSIFKIRFDYSSILKKFYKIILVISENIIFQLFSVGYILNVTKEVDNFFPTQFKYLKIWVSDEANTELLRHWQRTYDFIKEAK